MGATLYNPVELEGGMPFGKYGGQRFIDVARKNSGYIDWLLDNTEFNLDEEAANWFELLKHNTKTLGRR